MPGIEQYLWGRKNCFLTKKNTNNKKIQLCTAFGYNCFSIKSLLFWKEPGLTSSGGWGQPRVPPRMLPRAPVRRCRRGRAVVFGLAMPGKASSSPLLFLLSLCPRPPPPNGFACPPRSERTEPGERRGRGRRAPKAAGPPRRGIPDGESRTGAGPAAPCIHRGVRGPRKPCRTGPTGTLLAGRTPG